MAVFKCKMCGGALDIPVGASIVECEYCGTQQTVPHLDTDKITNLYDRANHFRRNNEFDKAAGIYEMILNENLEDSEAYWSLLLCRYGIEYVEDPRTHRRVPTVNRAQFTSIFDDENYKKAIKYADTAQKNIYQAEAEAINNIQKGILEISQKEEPFDVFICYKESDGKGQRTADSVLAMELYNELTRDGLKVFFSRVTLEDKLGTAYEPYIFAALNSAKVMVALGTKSEHFGAVWVKNEWSRYLSLIKNGEKKYLIPAFRDMDPYDLPEEFSHLQAQDMSKIGAMQDLVRGIKKLVDAGKPSTAGAADSSATEALAADAIRMQGELRELADANRRRGKMTKIVALCVAVLAVLAIAGSFVNKTVVEPQKEEQAVMEENEVQYTQAMALYEEGSYTQARAYFHRLGDYKDSIEMAVKCEEAAEKVGIKADENRPLANIAMAQVGEMIEFGSMHQSSTRPDAMPVEWIVLDRQEDRMLVISNHILYMRDFDSDGEIRDKELTGNITNWAESVARKWMHEYLYTTIFTEEEQSQILTVTTCTEDNVHGAPTYTGSGGKDVDDQMFLLSIEEAELYFSDNASRIATATPYSQDVEFGHSGDGYLDYVWWLRSAGSYPFGVASVGSDGEISVTGSYATQHYGIRPAMWIQIPQ